MVHGFGVTGVQGNGFIVSQYPLVLLLLTEGRDY